jgi:Carbohydrate esterase, sialic acid-specific acetylesterase
MKPSLKIRTLLLMFASLFPASRSLGADMPVQLPAKQDFHLFLLAGQSNMAGRGKLDDEARKPNPRIFSLNKNGEWQPAVDPLHWDKPAAGVGIGKAFAEIIAAQNPGIGIGLIPAACGGSPISTWAPGQLFDQTKSHPYDDAIARAKRALQDGTLKAILWHQGESDSNPKDAPEHEKRLAELIIRFRTELNAPDLPFIIGQLGRFPAKPWTEDREAVNVVHQAIAKRMKNVRFVPAEGMTSIGDNLHFDTPSLRTFAKGYADAYLQIVGIPKR